MNKEEQRIARDMLDKLHGRGKYNTPSNLCYGDGYFARSIKEKFGMSIEELEREIGYGD